jgi:hypothetical protein
MTSSYPEGNYEYTKWLPMTLKGNYDETKRLAASLKGKYEQNMPEFPTDFLTT